MNIDELMLDIDERMEKTLESTKYDMNKLRTGVASSAMLDGIMVDYYGTPTAINGLANIATPEPRLIAITAWDKSALGAIEKAILASDLGITPSNDGSVIRLNIPELTEERRKDLAKLAKKYAEDGKIAVRNIRRDANEAIKKLEKDSEISEDDMKRYLDNVQESTDIFVQKLDDLGKKKEAEILEI
jgi:ribosome recycling factor